MKKHEHRKQGWSNAATFKRYFRPFIPRYHKYLTARKLLNAARIELEMRKRKTIIKGKPYILHIELSNVCNLHCPECVVGNNSSKIKKGFMKFNDVKTIIDKLKDYVVFARLDGTGESLLNGDFFEIVKYIHSRGIGTVVSTNMQTIGELEAQAFIDTGLDYLIASIDGATQETYERYRVGGSLDKALGALRAIVRKKRGADSRLPFIEWQFLCFEHNKHEMEQAYQIAMDIGVDRFLIKNLEFLDAVQTREGDTKYDQLSEKTVAPACYWLWKVLNINWLGDCKTCCTDGLAEEFTIGNILRDDLETVWNGENSQILRGLFAGDREDWGEISKCKCYIRCPLVTIARQKRMLGKLPRERQSHRDSDKSE